MIYVVNAGIDTLKVNVKRADPVTGKASTLQELPEDLAAYLCAVQEHAKEQGKPQATALSFHGARLVVLPNGSPTWRYLVKNDCIQLALAPRLKIPMLTKVTFFSAYLWSVPSVTEAVEEAHSFLMDLFGPHLFLQAAQLDLCVDVAGLEPPSDWLEVFVSRARGKKAIEASQKERAHYTGHRLETILFSGHGRPVSCKLYNKGLEIRQHAPEKVWFHDLWRKRGWDGETVVSRIEFSLERAGLHQMQLEDIYETLRNVKRVWAYCTQEWLRMVTPGPDTNRTRWQTTAEWTLIQRAFEDYGDRALDALGPLVRTRHRAVNVEQMTAQIAGCATTLAAMCDELDADDEPAVLFSVVYDKVMQRWAKQGVVPQDIVREKEVLYSQVP